MDRSSADPAAQALKTKMLAERSWWSPVTFQRSQKPKARLGEEKGELPSGRGPCLHCLFLAKGSGLYQGTPENSQTISQSRMDGQYKEGGKRARGRSFWDSDTL